MNNIRKLLRIDFLNYKYYHNGDYTVCTCDVKIEANEDNVESYLISNIIQRWGKNRGYQTTARGVFFHQSARVKWNHEDEKFDFTLGEHYAKEKLESKTMCVYSYLHTYISSEFADMIYSLSYRQKKIVENLHKNLNRVIK